MKNGGKFRAFLALVLGTGIFLFLHRPLAQPLRGPADHEILRVETSKSPPPDAIGRMVTVQQTTKQQNRGRPRPAPTEATLGIVHHQLMIHQDLKLNPEEQKAVEDLYMEYQDIKASFEMPLVRKERSPPGVLILSIPTYREAGRELRKMFYADLREVLPAEKFEQLDDEIGGFIDDMFVGFGSLDQSFVVVRTQSPESGIIYAIERKLSRPKNTQPSPWVNPHFLESTGTATLTPEELTSGEFAGISREVFSALGNK